MKCFKKVLSVFAVAAMTVSLVGCSGGNDTESGGCNEWIVFGYSFAFFMSRF